MERGNRFLESVAKMARFGTHHEQAARYVQFCALANLLSLGRKRKPRPGIRLALACWFLRQLSSLADPSLKIVVTNDCVPPFRFNAGGWDLSRSSIEPGSAMKARIAEKDCSYFV